MRGQRSPLGTEHVGGIHSDVPNLSVSICLSCSKIANGAKVPIKHIACTQAIMLENPTRLLDEGEIEEPVLLDRLPVQEPDRVVRAVDVDQEVPPVVLEHLEATVELQVREPFLRDQELEVTVASVERPDQQVDPSSRDLLGDVHADLEELERDIPRRPR